MHFSGTYLNADRVYNNWNDLKLALRNTLDVDTTAIGALFKDAATYTSKSHRSLVEYYSRKLNLLQKLNWCIPVKDMVNIIIYGVDQKEIKHMALLNHYNTLDDLLTYFRSVDQNIPVSSFVPPILQESFKVTCHYCHKPGHMKYNCPNKRTKQQPSQQPKTTSAILCTHCSKPGHTAI